ncbi:MAG: hypothetical protein MH204_03070, partial [Fimbriimonadaceae bacterium]|nr:hypothetical protein [Fimbriimonadaceae bacterium]
MTTMPTQIPVRIRRRTRRGQTLVIAILLLGVLLILGLAFAGIVSRNVADAGRSRTRTLASDLAQSGITLSHYQLVNSRLGADWRPAVTPPIGVDAAGFTRDPDGLYLRPGTGLTIVPDPANPAATIIDRGGPDFLGPYTRQAADGGRRLVRVRYEPNQLDAKASRADGSLRSPGSTGNRIIIESIGRAGSVTVAGRIDPTLLLTEQIQIAGFANSGAAIQALNRARSLDQSLNPTTRRMVAFATIGLIDQARFITNKNRSSRPADIGVPTETAGGIGIGEGIGNSTVAPQSILGRFFPEPNPALRYRYGRSVAR